MTAEIISVGTELLLGNILNTNAQYLSRELADLGITVQRESTIGDNQGRLADFVNEAKARCDLLVFTGGLGPTADDLTKETVAACYGDTLAFDEEEWAKITSYFARTGRETHGPTIGIAWTDDFETFHQLENAFLPYNRNGVLFPRKIGGRFAMLSRPSDTGHTPFGDIFYSESPDMEFWGRHRHVMSPSAFEVSAWQCMKIGAGPVPIETSEGWLLFYHGVLRSCNGYVYAFGSALLDLEEPWKVTARSGPYLISPREIYELTGDVPNVTFPCASLHDPETGRIAVYYGCADTVTGLAFGYIPEIIDFTKKNNIL